MVVWAGGLTARPFVRGLGLQLDERGRLVIDRALRVPGRSGTLAIGDCAACPDAPVRASGRVRPSRRRPPRPRAGRPPPPPGGGGPAGRAAPSRAPPPGPGPPPRR